MQKVVVGQDTEYTATLPGSMLTGADQAGVVTAAAGDTGARTVAVTKATEAAAKAKRPKWCADSIRDQLPQALQCQVSNVVVRHLIALEASKP
jgi:hypothetical protein